MLSNHCVFQTKPLIHLQSDIDVDTGQRVLTCYLLPQSATEDKEGQRLCHGDILSVIGCKSAAESSA